MKLRILVFAAGGLFSMMTLAEEDKRYFSEYWNETDQENATYYRQLPIEKQDGLYWIYDYYMNGNLQAVAKSHDENAMELEGRAYWYYEDGALKTDTNFHNGKEVGVSHHYYEDGKLWLLVDRPQRKMLRYYPNGQLKKIRQGFPMRKEIREVVFYPDGRLKADGVMKTSGSWQGSFEVNEDGSHYQTLKYQNGELIGYQAVYQDNKTVAEEKNSPLGPAIEKVFYDRAGEEISRAVYEEGSGGMERGVDGVEQLFRYDADGLVEEIIGQTEYQSGGELTTITTHFNDVSQPVIATYSRAQGIDGQYYDPYTGTLFTYLEGKRDGEAACCFNRTGMQISGQYRHGDKDEGQFYDAWNRRLESYRNGRQDGEQIRYDKDGEILSLDTYKDGLLHGKRITRNPATENQYESQYEQGVAQSGEVYEYGELSRYEDGKRLEETRFSGNDSTPEEKRVYSPENTYELIYSETYRDGKTFAMEYRGGYPYQGESSDFEYELLTYQDGEKTGPYSINKEAYQESGHYKDGKKTGEITLTADGQTYTAIYEDDQPVSGYVYQPYYKTLLHYDEGKRNGRYVRYVYYKDTPYNRATGTYDNDRFTGTVGYFLDEETGSVTVGEGEFRDGRPWQGTFYDDELYTSVSEDDPLLAFGQKYPVMREYQAGEIVKEQVDPGSEQPLAILSYRDGKPWQGELFHMDSALPDQWTRTTYQEGMREGVETVYAPFYNLRLSENYYKNDQLEGEQTVFDQNGEVRFRATYKDGKPWTGEVVEKIHPVLDQIITYQEGRAQKSQLRTHYYTSEDEYDWLEGEYRDGKPFSGYFFSQTEKEELISHYQEGKLEQVFIAWDWGTIADYNDSERLDKAEATVSFGEISTEIAMRDGSKTVIAYEDEAKTSGEVDYFRDDGKHGGSLRFRGNRIIAAKGANYSGSVGVIRYRLANAEQLEMEFISLRNTSLRVVSEIPTEFADPGWLTLRDMEALWPKNYNGTQIYYYDKLRKPIASITYQDNQPYNGTSINYGYSDKPFRFSTYRDGELIDEYEGTMDAFLQKNAPDSDQ